MELRKYNDNKTRCESGINAEAAGSRGWARFSSCVYSTYVLAHALHNLQ